MSRVGLLGLVLALLVAAVGVWAWRAYVSVPDTEEDIRAALRAAAEDFERRKRDGRP